jgi:LmbE family N-acetylglucosaminyl deacetylase
MKVVLVVAAHPDDEVLGCGGAIARHVDAGDTVHVVFLTDGVGSRSPEGVDDAPSVAVRTDAANTASGILGHEKPQAFFFPDNQLDTIGVLRISQALEGVVADLEPQIIYTHGGGDLNVDHQIVGRAVLTACRPLPESTVEEIHCFEVASSTEWPVPGQGMPFTATTTVDITTTFDRKMQALKAYDGEMRPFPHARSYEAVEALARLRGSQSGLRMAESFYTARRIVR